MLKRRLLTTLITAAVGLGGYAMNAGAANVTGTANATILAPLAITEAAQMNFGDISPDTLSATTVVLDNANGVTSPDGAGLAGGTVASGQFTVTGVGNLSFAITLPGVGVVTLTDNAGNGGAAMAVENFTSNPAATGALAGGNATIFVGATLTVGANQTASTYDGAYDVTVNYN